MSFHCFLLFDTIRYQHWSSPFDISTEEILRYFRIWGKCLFHSCFCFLPSFIELGTGRMSINRAKLNISLCFLGGIYKWGKVKYIPLFCFLPNFIELCTQWHISKYLNVYKYGKVHTYEAYLCTYIMHAQKMKTAVYPHVHAACIHACNMHTCIQHEWVCQNIQAGLNNRGINIKMIPKYCRHPIQIQERSYTLRIQMSSSRFEPYHMSMFKDILLWEMLKLYWSDVQNV